MGAFLALVPILAQFVPELAGLLAGPAAGTALNHLGEVAQNVFGTIDAEQIKLKIAQDASLTDRFKAELSGRLQEVHDQLADLANARSQTVTLAQAGSLIAWGAPIVSIIITLGFFGVLTLYLSRPTGADNPIVTMLLGTLASAFGGVVQYWLGSSAGSKTKDAAMAQISSLATSTAAGAITSTARKMFR